MPKLIQCSVTQVRPGVFCIRPTSPEFRAGEQGGEVFVVRVTDTPDAITPDEVAKKLSHLIDPFDPPAIVTWAELKREQEGE